jgi:Integrase core domain
MKKWLRAQPRQPSSIDELQALIDGFVDDYNERRPHRSLAESSTPTAAYLARPKAGPGTGASDPHDRVRRDRVDKAGAVTLRVHGKLHHIGVGRIHTGTYVIMLVHELHVRVVQAATGELLRDFTLNPTRDYQPTGAPKGPARPRKS